MFKEVDTRMSCGSLFHAAGPAYEKARSPNLVRSLGNYYLSGKIVMW